MSDATSSGKRGGDENVEEATIVEEAGVADEPAETASAQDTASVSGSKLWRPSLAAMVGALISAGAMLLLAPAPADGPSFADLDAHARAFETRAKALEARANETESALRARINALTAELDAKSDASATRAKIGGLDATIATVEERLGAVEAARPRERERALTDLREQVSALAAAIAGGATPRGDSAENSNAAVVGFGARLALLEGALSQLEDRVAGVSGGPPAGETKTRFNDLETALATLRADVDALSPITERMDALESGAQAAADAKASLGAALSVLAQAVASGAPFAEALATLERIARLEVDSALADQAATGAPALGALASNFDGASRKALAAMASAPGEDESFADSLTRRLSSVVTVRRVGETEGDAPSAVLSRAEARIDAGDVDAALAELQKLPREAQDAMSDWLAEARRRKAAEDALDDLRLSLLPN